MVRNGIPANAVAWLTADLAGLAPALGGDGKDAIEPWRQTHLWLVLRDQLKSANSRSDRDVVPWMGTRLALCVLPGHERWPVLELSVRDGARAQDFMKTHFAAWKPDPLQPAMLSGPDGGAVALVDDQMFLADSTEGLTPLLDTWAGSSPRRLPCRRRRWTWGRRWRSWRSRYGWPGCCPWRRCSRP